MLATLQMLIFGGAVWAVSYWRCAPKLWLPIILLSLVGLTLMTHLTGLLVLLWLGFVGIAIAFNVPKLRQRWLTRPVLRFFRKVLPPMSTTEREALDAGDVWWDGELFSGRPHWHKFLSLRKPSLTAEEQAFLDNQVETLCSLLDDWQIVQRDNDLPVEVWDYLKQHGFFGLNIDKAYGGLGFSALAHSQIIVKIATRSISAAVNTMVPNSLGPAELLQHYGTTEQKNYYLPRLAEGEEVPCFALTGPDAGSDAGAMPDQGVVCRGEYQGQEVLGIRLSWDKRYITLAPIATVIGVAFKLYDPQHLLGQSTDIGITLCLIPANHPGVEIGQRHCPLNSAFMNGPTRGQNVFIPLDWIIGGPQMAGQGWRMLMECLAVGRAISLPALSGAGTQLAYRMTGIYARLRKQFKISIGKFEGVAEALSRLAGYNYILEAARLTTADAVDQQIKPAVISAIAKYHMTEMMRTAMNDAMDVHAGRGIQLGPRNYLGHIYQTVPVAITVEGANILTRNLIIFGQGAIRCHPYVRQEMAAAADSDTQRGLQQFDNLLFAHIGFALSNLVRSLTMGLTAGRFIHAPVKGPMAYYYQQLTRMSSALALVADVSMLVLGGDLKRKERLSARLGDVLSYLYLASAVLKYYADNPQADSDKAYASWSLQTLLYKTYNAFDEFCSNFPYHWVGVILRKVIFPWGQAYRAPLDKLGQQLAKEMLEPGELRERLSYLCYSGTSSDDAIGRMEHAWQLSLQAEAIDAKLQAAIKNGAIVAPSLTEQFAQAEQLGLLSAEDVQVLRDFEAARWDAMQVDEFNADYFIRKK